ncbi:hypothetical protein BHM03_00037365 [Ensete ventricosum]|uniref:Uncharacterized protein n=1 Tax=Ensete ventricosum TaxID=4639 RepID=A0A445MJN9_ENSVE|nr:hypothetical protein BHM03_00037365 [Ensete ventricosum]
MPHGNMVHRGSRKKEGGRDGGREGGKEMFVTCLVAQEKCNDYTAALFAFVDCDSRRETVSLLSFVETTETKSENLIMLLNKMGS